MTTQILLTISQAAHQLNVSTKTLRRWEESGRLTSIRTDGGHRRYPESEILKLKQTKKHKRYQPESLFPLSQTTTTTSAPVVEFVPLKTVPASPVSVFTPKKLTDLGFISPVTQPVTPSPVTPRNTPVSVFPHWLRLPAIAFTSALMMLAGFMVLNREALTQYVSQHLPLIFNTYQLPANLQPTEQNILGLATSTNPSFTVNIQSTFKSDAEFLSNAAVRQDLTVDGSANIAKNINFTQSNTNLTSSPQYIIASSGLAVGGASTYYINGNGTSKFRDGSYTGAVSVANNLTVGGTVTANGPVVANSSLTANGLVNLGNGSQAVNVNGNAVTLTSGSTISLKPNGDGDDYLYLSTTANQPGMFFAGTSPTNDPGIRINTDTGKIEYRDENSDTWSSLDSLKTPEITQYLAKTGTALYPLGRESLRIYDTTGTNYIDIAHSGTQALITSSGTNNISFDNNLIINNAKTLSLTDGGLLDLSAIQQNDTTPQGIKLPQSAVLSPIVGGGAGYMAYDSSSQAVKVFNGTTWTNISGASSTLQQAYEAGNTIDMQAANGSVIITTGGTTQVMTLDQATGNVGIGDTTPTAKLSVGLGGLFQVNSSGNITTIGGVAHSLADNTGNLTLTSAGTLYFDDSRLSAALPLTLTDVALNSNLRQGIVDALNDLYSLANSAGAQNYWSRDTGLIYPTNTFESLALGGNTTGSATIYADATTGNITSTGSLTANSLYLRDTNQSNKLNLVWNENDTLDRTLNLLVSGADRSLTLSGNVALNQDLLTTSNPSFTNLTLTGNLEAATATVSSTLGFGRTLTSDVPVCNGATEGTMFYNASSFQYFYCNGTTWQSIAQGGTTQWTEVGGLIYPNLTTTDVAIGGINASAPLYFTAATGAIKASSLNLSATQAVSGISTATDLGAGSASNTNLSTQLAVKTYVDNQIGGTNSWGVDNNLLYTLYNRPLAATSSATTTATFTATGSNLALRAGGTSTALTVDNAGNVLGGTYNGLTIVGNANSLTLTGNASLNQDLLTSSTPTFSSLNLTNSAWDQNYWDDITFSNLATAASTLVPFIGLSDTPKSYTSAGQAVVINGTNNGLTFVDPATLGTNYWQLNGEQLAPNNALWQDVLVGGTSTGAATIALQASTGNIKASSLNLSGTQAVSGISTETDLGAGAPSDSNLSTQKAIKTYVDNQIGGTTTWGVDNHLLYTLGNAPLAATSSATTTASFTSTGSNLALRAGGQTDYVTIDQNGNLNSTGSLTADSLFVRDSNQSNTANLVWNENDTVDRLLYFSLGGANRSLTLSGDLNVAAASAINQDLQTSASPAFVNLTLTGNLEAATATVSSTLGFGRTLTSDVPVCNGATEGTMFYNASSFQYFYCNGTTWQSIAQGGTTQWTEVGGLIYPNLTTTDVAVGGTDINAPLYFTAATGAIKASSLNLSATQAVTGISNDTTLSANSDSNLSTQKAIKTYVDNQIGGTTTWGVDNHLLYTLGNAPLAATSSATTTASFTSTGSNFALRAGGTNNAVTVDASGNLVVAGTTTLSTVASAADTNVLTLGAGGVVHYLDTTNWDKSTADDVTTFLGLSDTPSSYTGAGQVAVINGTNNGLTFVDPATLGTNYWQLNGEQLAPNNALWQDVLVGGTSTGAATIALEANTGAIKASSLNLSATQAVTGISNDTTLSANSDSNLSTQKAIKTYVDNQIGGSNAWGVDNNLLYTLYNRPLAATSSATTTATFTAGGTNLAFKAGGSSNFVTIDASGNLVTTGTINGTTLTGNAHSLTLTGNASLNQDLLTSSTPTFSSLNLTNSAWDQNYWDDITFSNLATAASTLVPFIGLSDTPKSYTSAGQAVVINGTNNGLTFVDPATLGTNYWQLNGGVVTPKSANVVAATSSATTVATFTSLGSNLAFQAGGNSNFVTIDASGNLVTTGTINGTTLTGNSHSLTLTGDTTLDQDLQTSASPAFVNLTLTGNLEAATATVSSTLGFGRTLTSDVPVCNGATEGTMFYNASSFQYFYCNGTTWQSIAQGGTTQWTEVGGLIYPNLTTTDVAVGGTDINAPLYFTAATGAIKASSLNLSTTQAVTGISNDTTLSANSDSNLSTQKAIKTYVDNQIGGTTTWGVDNHLLYTLGNAPLAATSSATTTATFTAAGSNLALMAGGTGHYVTVDTTGNLIADNLFTRDTNQSNTLELKWNENDTSDRVLNLLLGGANRSLTLSGDLNVVAASAINQDLQTSASPAFVNLTLTGNLEAATATVSSTLGFGRTLTSDVPVCNGATEGTMFYNASSFQYFYCNGTTWQSIAQGGTTQWTEVGGLIYPNLTTTDVAVGGTDINAPLYFTAATGAIKASSLNLSTTQAVTGISNDTTLSANSDSNLSTQKAIKTYVDNQIGGTNSWGVDNNLLYTLYNRPLAATSSATTTASFTAGGTNLAFEAGGVTNYTTIDNNGNVTIRNGQELRLGDTDSSNYTGFKSPAVLDSNYLYTLPTNFGTDTFVLTSNGAGGLSWTNPTGLGTNYWQLNGEQLAPNNALWQDVLVGGTSTGAATIALEANTGAIKASSLNLSATQAVTGISNDTTLSANSDSNLSTQKAIKTYVDNQIGGSNAWGVDNNLLYTLYNRPLAATSSATTTATFTAGGTNLAFKAGGSSNFVTIDASGNLVTTGTINGTTLTGNAHSLTLTGNASLNQDLLTSSTPTFSSLNLTNSAWDQNYWDDITFSNLATAASTLVPFIGLSDTPKSYTSAGQAVVINGTNNGLTFVDPATLGTNYWQLNGEQLAPNNALWQDVLVGGTSTGAATIALEAHTGNIKATTINGLSLAGTGYSLTLTGNASLNQDLLTSSTPTFSSLNLTNSAWDQNYWDDITFSNLATAASTLVPFIGLSDTPTSYTAAAGKIVRVKDDLSGLEFVDPGTLPSSNYWQINGEQLAPNNALWQDVLVGGTSTGAATIALEAHTGNIKATGLALSGTQLVTGISTSDTLTEDSDSNLSTQKAIKTYVDNQIGGTTTWGVDNHLLYTLGNAPLAATSSATTVATFTSLGSNLAFQAGGSSNFVTINAAGDLNSTGNVTGNNLFTRDTNQSNTLELKWNEDRSSNQVLNLITGAADRTLTLSGDLNVAAASAINQDVQTSASPTFTGLTLSALTGTGSLRLASLNGANVVGTTDASAWDQNYWDDITFSNIASISASLGTNYWDQLNGGVVTPKSANVVAATSSATTTASFTSTGANFALRAGGTTNAVTVDASGNLVAAGTINGTTLTGNAHSLTLTGNASLNQDVQTSATPSFTNLILSNQGELRLFDGSSHYTGFKAPADLTGTSEYMYTLPADYGTNTYVMQTNGTGGLSWANPASLGTNYWQLNDGTLSPFSNTADLTVGGTSTASATFQAFANGGLVSSGQRLGQALVTLNQTGNQDILTASAAGVTRFTLSNDGSLYAAATDTTTNAFTFNADSLTQGVGLDLSADALTTGQALNITSTSNGLTSGNLVNLYWNPSSGTATGDLMKINIGASATLTGNLLALYNNGSDVFKVSPTKITNAVPTEFTSSGDVTMAYDLMMSNQAQANIDSKGPLAIRAGDLFESNNLTLKTYNAGNILFDLAAGGGGVGIGADITPNGMLDVNGAKVGQALVQLNETGDQNILTASASGTTVMTLGRTGNLSLTNSGTTNADINLSSTGDFTISDNGTPFATFTDSGTFILDSLTLDGTSLTSSGNLNLTSAAANDIILTSHNNAFTWPTTTGSNGSVLTTNGAGTMSWTTASSLNYWQLNGEQLAPNNALWQDVLVGGTSTGAATIALEAHSGNIKATTINGLSLAGTGYSLTLTGNASLNQDLLTSSTPTFSSLNLTNSAWDQNYWDDITFSNLATAASTLVPFIGLSDTPHSYTSAGQAVVINGTNNGLTFVDPATLGTNYWQLNGGVVTPKSANVVAATSSATTVATFTSLGSNLAFQAGGNSNFVTINAAGDLNSTGNVTGNNLFTRDTNQSNTLELKWNEDRSSNQVLNLITGAADRTLTLSGDLNVAAASAINQDVQTSASPTFTGLTLSALTGTGSLRLASLNGANVVGTTDASAWDQNYWDDITFSNIASISASLGTNYWDQLNGGVVTPKSANVVAATSSATTTASFTSTGANFALRAGGTTNAVTVDASGNLVAAGTINGTTLTGNAHSLTLTGNASLNQDLLTSSTPTFSSLNLTNSAWDQNYWDDITFSNLATAASTLVPFIGLSDTPKSYTSAGQAVVINGTNNGLTFVDPATLGTNYWQLNDGALAPFSTTADLLIGGTSTASAKISLNATTGDIRGTNLIASASIYGHGDTLQFSPLDLGLLGSGSNANQGSVGNSINANGAITGYLIMADNSYHAFIRDADGTVHDLGLLGGGSSDGQGSWGNAINDSGAITGFLIMADNSEHAFIRDADGTVHDLGLLGDGSGAGQGSVGNSINANGAITGYLIMADNSEHAFIRDADGTFHDLGLLGGGSFNGQGSRGISINNSGAITGYLIMDDISNHAFIRDADGTFHDLGLLGGGSDVYQGSWSNSINDNGAITGTLVMADYSEHAFIRDADDTFHDLGLLGGGSADDQGSWSNAINNSGAITGHLIMADNSYHAFTRDADGTFHDLGLLGGGSDTLHGSIGNAINAGGAITGNIIMADDTTHTLLVTSRFTTLPLAAANQTGLLSENDWTTFNSKVSSQWLTNASDIYFNTGNVGMGTTAPNGKLQISGGNGSNANLIVNQANNADILTASASGSTRLTLSNTGDITLASGTSNADTLKISPNSTGANAFTGTLTSADLTGAQTWTLPNGTGTLALTSQLPTQYWQLNGEQLAPNNALWQDVLVGGTSTGAATIALEAHTGNIKATTINGLSLAGTGYSLTLTGNASLNQDLLTSSTPTFSSLNLTNSAWDQNYWDDITFSNLATAASTLVPFIGLSDTPHSYTSAGQAVVINGTNNGLTFVDPATLGTNYWQLNGGVVTPKSANVVAATSSATTVATFTSLGSNLAFQAGGNSNFVTINAAGDLNSTGNVTGNNLFTRDTNQSNTLELKWNEDRSSNQVLNLITGAADRTLTLSGDLNVAAASAINQDVQTSASPTFTGLTLSALTGTGSLRLASLNGANVVGTTDASAWDQNYWDDITFSNLATAAASLIPFTGLKDTPSSYTAQGLKVVRVNSGATGLEFVDAATVGTNYWNKTSEGILSPLFGEPVAATSSATTTASFTSTGANFALRAGGTTNAVTVDASGNLVAAGTINGTTLTGNAHSLTLNDNATLNQNLQTTDSPSFLAATLGNLSLATNTLTTSTGNLVLDSAGGLIVAKDNFQAEGAATISGTLTLNGVSAGADSRVLGISSSTGLVSYLDTTNWDKSTADDFVNPMTTAGDLIFGNTGGAPDHLAGSTTNGWILSYNIATHAPYWLDPGTLPSSNYWQINGEQLSPNNALWQDVLVGGTSTSAATIALQANTGAIKAGSLSLTNQGELRLYDANSHYTGFKAPNDLTGTSEYMYTLPVNYGSNGQVLTSNGAGTLSWTDTVSSSYWQLNEGALSPFSSAADFLVGSTATASATFRAAGLQPTSGDVVDITGTALTSGGLLNLAWNPGSPTTDTGDLLKLDVGSNGTLTGNLLALYNHGSPIFTVSPTQITANVPTQFTSSGDVSLAYDLIMDNPTLSNIKSASNLTIAAGETYTSSDLTLKTYGSGNIIFDNAGTANDIITSTGNLGLGTTAPNGRLEVNGEQVGKALAIFNQNSLDQNILAASASGTTVLTLGRTGNLSLINSGSTNADINLASTGDFTISDNGTPYATFTDSGTFILDSLTLDGTTLASSGNLNLSSAAGNDVILNSHGNSFTWPTSAGVGGQVLKTNGAGTLSWTDAASANYWQMNSGTLSPFSNTLDVLVGATSTASALFHIYADTGAASMSGTLTTSIIRPPTDTLALQYKSGPDSWANALTIQPTTGNVGIGTASPNSTLDVLSPALAGDGEAMARFSVSDDPTSVLQFSNSTTSDGVFSPRISGINSSTYTALVFTGKGTTDSGTSALTVFDSRIGNNLVAVRPLFEFRNYTNAVMNILANGDVGIGTTAPNGRLEVNGEQVGKALAIFNQNSLDQNIIAASASGTTVLTLGRTGNLSLVNSGSTNDDINLASTGDFTISDNGTPYATFTDSGTFLLDSLTLDGTALTSSANLNLTSGGSNDVILTSHGNAFTWPTTAGVGGQVLKTNGAGVMSWVDNGGGSTNYWQMNSGTLSPFSNTLDVLVGATSTASALFHIYADTGAASMSGTLTTSIIRPPTDTLALQYKSGPDSWANALTIQPTTGNVGIGTASPNSTLDVLTPSSAATAETMARFGVSDDTGSSLQLSNVTTTNNVFMAHITGINSSTYTALDFTGKGTTDTGTSALTVFDSRIGSGVASVRPLFDFRNYATSVMEILANGNVGIGTTAPDAKLQVSGASVGKALSILNETGDQAIFSASASGTTKFTIAHDGSLTATSSATTATAFSLGADNVSTGYGIDLSADVLTSGTALNLTSTSSILTNGKLLSLDWSPAFADTATGDLFKVNIGSSATLTGNLLALYNNGSSVFTVSPTLVTSSVPTAFTSIGDVAIANDLVFTNQTASTLQAYGPLTIDAGESFESNNLTLKTYNSGAVVFNNGGTDLGSLSSTGFAIGTPSASYRLQVFTSNPATAAAMIENGYDMGAQDSTGLIIKMGLNATNPGTNDAYTRFMRGDGFVLGKITGNGSGAIAYNTAGVDFAEYFRKANPSDNLLPGTLICQTPDGISACATTNQPILGVISSSPAFVGGSDHEQDPAYALVGLLGQVPVTVSAANGPITAGDALTIAPITGQATKATHSGYIVGHALASTATDSVILASIQPSWFDPQALLDGQGNLSLTGNAAITGSLTVGGTNVMDNLSSLNTAYNILHTDITRLTASVSASTQAITTNTLGVGSPAPASDSGKLIDTASGAYLSTSGVWTNVSDAAKKENFTNLNKDLILSKIINLPVTRWNYLADDASVTHIGPTAQDFYSAFGVGDNNTTISTLDPAGIALVGIQALHDKLTGFELSQTGKLYDLASLTKNNLDELTSVQATVSAIAAKQLSTEERLSELESLTATLAARPVTPAVLGTTTLADLSGQPATPAADLSLTGLVPATTSASLADLGMTKDELVNLVDDLKNLRSDLYLSTMSADLTTSSMQGSLADSLTVTGDTLLNNVGLTGTLTTGFIQIDGIASTITTTLEPLRLQTNALAGNIEAFNQKIVMTPEGNILVTGTLSADKVVAREVVSQGAVLGKLTIATSAAELDMADKIFASAMSPANASGSANGQIGSLAEAADATAGTHVATASAVYNPSIGSATLPANQTLLTINNAAITANSKVFVTATSLTTQNLSVIQILPGQGFVVAIPQPVPAPLTFNWWIIN